jgi:hypothetical protein
MRSAVSLLCATLMVAGCSLGRTATLSESETVQSAQSASILGDWVLSNAERTQFVGASRVELRLEPGEFRLVAEYTGAPTLVVDGSASFDPNGGLLTLTPRSNTRASSGDPAPLLPVGTPLVMLATAADNTMVFAEPGEKVHMPTSVWHRARTAPGGGVDARLSQSDSLSGR